MAGIEDITPSVEIVGVDDAAEGLRNLGVIGAEAFAKIAEAAAQGNFTGLATLIGGDVAGAFVQAAQAVLEFVDAQAHSVEVLSNLAEATGMTLPQIEGMKNAFASVGISANGFERAIGRLAITVGQEWSTIEQAIRTSATTQERVLEGTEQAALNTTKAYEALREASTHAAQTSEHDAESVRGATLSLAKANDELYRRTKGAEGTKLNPQDANQLKIDEARLAADKAKNALRDAEIKQYEDAGKQLSALEQAHLNVEKAETAEKEAAEKAHEVDLKDLPKIAAELEKVATGAKSWEEVSNHAEISAQNLQKALILASSHGTGVPPGALDVYKEMSALFEHMGNSAEAMNAKLEIVQHTMGAGFRAGQASAAQLLAILERGPEALEKFNAEADKFAQSGIGLSDKDADALKEFNSSWSQLNAILDQVKAHFAAIAASGLTNLFDAARASIENTDGSLHKIIEAFSSIEKLISDVIEVAGNLLSVFSKFSDSPISDVAEGIKRIADFLDSAVKSAGALITALKQLPSTLGFGGSPSPQQGQGQNQAGQAAAQTSTFGTALEAVTKVAEDAINPFHSLIDIGTNLEKVTGWINEFGAAVRSATPTAAPGRAGGGEIHGPGGSTADRAGLFALSDGEFVVRAAAVQQYGAGLFHALNNLSVAGFAEGGGVGRISVAPGIAGHQGSSILNLTIGEHKFDGLRAPENVATRLKTFAVNRQTTATGRNPTWMR